MQDTRIRLSTLWVFLLFNYLYCDVMGLYDASFVARLSREGLLAASLLMEIPIAMILLSRVLGHRSNRRVNLVAGAFMAVVQAWSLTVGSGPTAYYAFFSAIEIGCLMFILWTAWRWVEPALKPQIV